MLGETALYKSVSQPLIYAIHRMRLLSPTTQYLIQMTHFNANFFRRPSVYRISAKSYLYRVVQLNKDPF